MASITQTIPNFFGGISEVPDNQKGQGQLVHAFNVLTDINKGVFKRPPARRISDNTSTNTADHHQPLAGATNDGTWFHYYRDEKEGSYIGQVQSDGSVDIWDADTGVPQTVNTISEPVKDYLKKDRTIGPRHNEDLQFTTIADTTFVNNRNVTVAWDVDSEGVTLKTPDHLHKYSAFIELKQIQNGRQYGLNIHNPDVNTTTSISTATRLSVEPVADLAGGLTEGFGSNNDAYTGNEGHCPKVGTKIFVKDDGDKKNLIGRLTVTGQQGPKPGNDNLDGPNDFTCKYTATVELLHGGEGWLGQRTETVVDDDGNETQVTYPADTVTVNLAGSSYTITVEDYETVEVRASRKAVRPKPTPFDQQTNASVDSILGSITKKLPDVIKHEVIGNGIYLYTLSTDTNIKKFTVEAQNTDLLTVINQEVNSITELPFQCKDGFIVKVVNSNVAEDDYHLRFEGIDGDGPGTWVECAAPNINRRLKRDTMPIVIKRDADNDFTVEEFNYSDREVGDTEYDPSFIGKKINKVIHFRNRLGFLSDSNIVLSQPGDLTNFFINTALTVSGVDPIDISSSSQYPGELYDAIEINTGLLVFGEKQQFLLATDSDILNPETARLGNISSYNYNKNVPPFSLGTTAGFVDNAGSNSRFFVMSNVAREGEPNVTELSKVVSRQLDNNLDLVANSRENTIVLFGKTGSNELFVYKYFNVADRQVQSSWTKWTFFVSSLKYMCAIGNSVYIIDSRNYLQKIDLVEDDTSPKLMNGDLNNIDSQSLIYLDNYVVLSGSVGTYDTTTDKTTFDFTNIAGFNDNSGYSALDLIHVDSGLHKDQIVIYNTNRVFEVDGNWTSGNVVAGNLIPMVIEFPTLFVQKQEGDRTINETRGSLVIHRCKFFTTGVGEFFIAAKRGSSKTNHFIDFVNPGLYDKYKFDDINIDEEFSHTSSIYLRNTDLTLSINSLSPYSFNLVSLTWEGDYTPKYYKNV